MYNTGKIEKKWQKIWEKSGIYKVKDKVKDKKNFYHLVMFPYPSGDLHMGHWYNYAPADVYARLKKMQGFNILSPIGFDALVCRLKMPPLRIKSIRALGLIKIFQ